MNTGSEKSPTASIGNAPVAGFGVRFETNGPNSAFVAWFLDEVLASTFANENSGYRAVVFPATVTFS